MLHLLQSRLYNLQLHKGTTDVVPFLLHETNINLLYTFCNRIYRVYS